MRSNNTIISDSSTLIDAVKFQFPEIDDTYNIIFSRQREAFEVKLDLCYSYESKMKIIIDELEAIKEILNDPLLKGFSLIINKSLKELSDRKNDQVDNLKKIFKLYKLNSLDELKQRASENGEVENNLSALNDILDAMSKEIFSKREKKNSTKLKTRKDKENINQDVINLQPFSNEIIRLFHIRNYFGYLKKRYQENDKNSILTQKIIWLGTQRDQAELLIELERKNFIPENESKKASAYFTKSNSIDKLLDYKGEFNLSKERYSYPKIFGTNAVNKFEKILPNPKPTKD